MFRTKKTIARIGAALLMAAAHLFAAAIAARAAPDETCRVYARRAVAQFEAGRAKGARLRGEIWSGDFDYHHRWCRRGDVDIAALAAGTRRRMRALGDDGSAGSGCAVRRVCSGDVKARRSVDGWSAQGRNLAEDRWLRAVLEAVRKEVARSAPRTRWRVDPEEVARDRDCLTRRNIRRGCWKKGFKTVCQIQGEGCLELRVCRAGPTRCDKPQPVLCTSIDTRDRNAGADRAVAKWERKFAHRWSFDPERRYSCRRSQGASGWTCTICAAIR